MYKKILEKVASAGTVALLGYEIGTHTVDGDATKVNTSDHNTNIVIFGVVAFAIILMVIVAKLILKKRPLVWFWYMENSKDKDERKYS